MFADRVLNYGGLLTALYSVALDAQTAIRCGFVDLGKSTSEKSDKQPETEEAEAVTENKVTETTTEEDKQNKKSEIVVVKEAKKEDEVEEEVFFDEEETETSPVVAPEILDDVTLDRNIKDAVDFLQISEKEVRLTILVALYRDMSITTEMLYKHLNPKDTSEMVFVNTVSHALGGLIINTSYRKEDDVFMLYDKPENMLRILDYESSYEGMKDSLVLHELVNKASDLLALYNKKLQEEAGEENPEPTTPIMFLNTNMKMDIGNGIPKGQAKKLSAAFKDLLVPYENTYQFNGLVNMAELVINKSNGLESHLVDYGTIFGAGICILPVINGGMYPVSVTKDPDIVAKFLANKNYIPTMEEYQRICSRIHNSAELYTNYDMSSIIPLRGKLGDYERDLVIKLIKITKLPWGTMLPILPRMRITSFRSIDDFYLTSDDKVKVVSLNGFNQLVYPFIIRVNGNTITIEFNNGTEDVEIVQSIENITI